MSEIRSLENRLTKYQLSSARMISALQKEMQSRSQRHDSREKELNQLIAQLKSSHKIPMVKPTVTGPPTVIDMADDASDSDSVVSRMTVGQTSAVSSLQTQSRNKLLSY